jgi:hypothetical protein
MAVGSNWRAVMKASEMASLASWRGPRDRPRLSARPPSRRLRRYERVGERIDAGEVSRQAGVQVMADGE